MGLLASIRIPLCVYKERRYVSFLNHILKNGIFLNLIIMFIVWLMYIFVLGEGIVHNLDFCLIT